MTLRWILCLVMAPLAGALAQPKMTFSETTHLFGEIPEEGGKVRHTFTFTNGGDEPLIVTGVTASCGCTTPSWTKEAVAPGAKGEIVAEYNPYNRPGRFNKTLTVRSNAVNTTMTLHIMGMVEPKPRTPELDFPTNLGGLRVQSQYLQMGNITTEKPVVQLYKVHNATAESLYLVDDYRGPRAISVKLLPDTLASATSGMLEVRFDPADSTVKLGYQSLPFRFSTNQPEQATKALVLLATVEEYFPPMSEEELANAPHLVMETKFHDFGDMEQGEQDSTVFVLKNEGPSPLLIREVRPNCGCATASISAHEIAPGATAELTVAFESTGRRGLQNKSVTIFSNDPRAPTQDVKIKAVVDTPE